MESLDADVIVIGSGIAGALCAYRLAQHGVRTLMLEAGPAIQADQVREAFRKSPYLDNSAGYPNEAWAERPDWSQQDRYLIQAGPDSFSAEYIRAVGGTTWHWAGGSKRLSPVDFEMRRRYGVGTDWPLSYGDLEPWYCQAEKELGVAGDSTEDPSMPRSAPYPMPPHPPSYLDRWVTQRLQPAGVHLRALPVARNSQAYDGRSACQGFSTCFKVCPSGARYTATVHVQKAIDAGARLVANAPVVRLMTEGARISAALVRFPDGSEKRARAQRFVLAANALESARILLNSANVAHPKGLGNRSGQVGRRLMDHPGCLVQYVVSEAVFPGRGPTTNLGCAQYGDGDFRRQRSGFTFNLQNTSPVEDVARTLLTRGLRPPFLDRALRHRARHTVQLYFTFEPLASDENRVTLDRGQLDRHGMPKMRIHYALGDYEKAGYAAAQETIHHMAYHLGATETLVAPLSRHSHVIGTLCMGTDPRRSVADANGRSHDHPNLYIAGSALFPTSGLTGPTLTIAALSLKTAHAMIQDQPT